MHKYSGFTLVELVVVIVLLGILGSVAMGKFEDLGDAAEHAKVDSIFATASSYLSKMNSMRYNLAGSPNNSTYVSIDAVSVRFRNGLVRNTQTNAHVPPGTPNRNNQATRFWYMIFSAPPPVITRTDNSSAGWAMYTGAANCGVTRSRCWKYRRAGTELAVITYEFTNGTTTLVKNF
ncbi:MAG: prepilin-type N-terminal cleavage/methylation domain-containing protein [Gammaproteobacteria bacterium]|nr:prepilin-type N-terminal cleavage/methylation domain-containing protein [Gammaproteobacteria bacterium]